MKVSEFDFHLPEDLIALRPASPRDSARLLVVREGNTQFEEASVRDLPAYLRTGDVMIANDTKVLPVQLSGMRPARGASPDAQIGVTLHTRGDSGSWLAFAKPGRKLETGDRIDIAPAFHATVAEKRGEGDIRLLFNVSGAELDAAIAQHGMMPLPPYIAGARPADERDTADYQTIFARKDGAVAAPTAGLHFTPSLLDALAAKGIARETLTLHVGPGTFLPMKAEDTRDHVMHAEWGQITTQTAARLNRAHADGGRLLAVGTTSLRLLETATHEDGTIAPFAGDTRIFITPGVQIKSAQMLLTNFHLPKSTLFMLVSAFCGLETMRAAYANAVARRFRFYSYGDACLLIRKDA
jgi:S-adenosylmethionine:tRNA ribosyltransferase-isomerase